MKSSSNFALVRIQVEWFKIRSYECTAYIKMKNEFEKKKRLKSEQKISTRSKFARNDPSEHFSILRWKYAWKRSFRCTFSVHYKAYPVWQGKNHRSENSFSKEERHFGRRKKNKHLRYVGMINVFGIFASLSTLSKNAKSHCQKKREIGCEITEKPKWKRQIGNICNWKCK